MNVHVHACMVGHTNQDGTLIFLFNDKKPTIKKHLKGLLQRLIDII